MSKLMKRPVSFFLLVLAALVSVFVLVSVVDAAVIQAASAATANCADCRLPVIQLALWWFFRGALCGAAVMFLLSFTPPDASGTAAGRTPAASNGEQQ